MVNAQVVIELLIDGATLAPCSGGALLALPVGPVSVLVPSAVIYELIAQDVIELVDGVYSMIKAEGE